MMVRKKREAKKAEEPVLGSQEPEEITVWEEERLRVDKRAQIDSPKYLRGNGRVRIDDVVVGI